MIHSKIPDRPTALDIIHRLATQFELRTATAESLTSGMISAALATRSGSSAYHQGGIVAYNIDAKVNLLDVPRDMAERCNCVSDSVALCMAIGARQAFGDAELVIAVTGYAESWPDGDIKEPFAHYTIFCGEACSSGMIRLDGMGRESVREAVVTETLRELAAMLIAAYES